MADPSTMMWIVAIIVMAVFVMVVIGGGTYAAYRVAERPDPPKSDRRTGSSPDEGERPDDRLAA
jgi:hypothetical protein